MKPGDDALLAIRATGIYLSRSAAEAPHLSGRVADVAFRGRGYEHAIDIRGLGRLTGVFARHRADRGDVVGLRLDPEGCHLFPATTSTPQAATPPPALAPPLDHKHDAQAPDCAPTVASVTTGSARRPLQRGAISSAS